MGVCRGCLGCVCGCEFCMMMYGWVVCVYVLCCDVWAKMLISVCIQLCEGNLCRINLFYVKEWVMSEWQFCVAHVCFHIYV